MTAVSTTKLNAILKKHQKAEMPEPPSEPEGRQPVDVLIHSFLLWNATPTQASDAFRKLRAATVDSNDLRVSLPGELVSMIGTRYPKSAERVQRLRASLNDIYRREHAVDLESLAAGGKREAKSYVESLEGMIPFVAARTLLLCYGVHGIPVDDSLRDHLVAAGVAEESATPEELAASLGRQIKADAAESAHASLLAFAETTGTKGRKTSGRTASGGRTKRSSAKTSKA